MKCVLDPNISKPHALRTAKQAAGILHSLSAEVNAAESLAEHFSDQPFVRLLPQKQLFADADFAVAVGGYAARAARRNQYRYTRISRCDRSG